MNRLDARLVRTRAPLGGPVVLRGRSRSGTDVYVARMPGFTAASAILTTRFGSMDTHLPDGTPLPDGTAHFLEHTMFQVGGQDVFDVYAARGAAANAFTTFSSTSYLFTSTGQFDANLRTLLETLRELDANDAVIEREKKIIGQEIAMYADDPAWRAYFNLMQALYRRHPVRLDIAGTNESIAGLDLALLDRVQRAFYHPRNLILVVAGDVDPAGVLALADEVLVAAGPGRRNVREPVRETKRPACTYTAESLSVSRPHVVLGLKTSPPGRGRRLAQRQVQDAMVLELLFGDGGRIEAPLYREGLVDDSLSAGLEAEGDYAHAIISADVDDAALFHRRVARGLRDAAASGTRPEEMERVRRKARGQHLRTFNSPEATAYWLLGQALDNLPLDARVKALDGASARMLDRRLKVLAAAPRALSVVLPRT